MSIPMQNLKVALVHDWILNIAGDIKVLKAFHELFPEAPIYTIFHNPEFTKKFMPDAEIRPSLVQKYMKYLKPKVFLPFLPEIIESMDLSEYDLIISTAPFSKGLILKPKTIHINYCSSPLRQIWDWQSEYAGEEHQVPKILLALAQHFLRFWDRQSSRRADYLIANSFNTHDRIAKYYRLDSKVIYPPVITANQPSLFEKKVKLPVKDYFLIVSRLYHHKNVHHAVKAFNKLGWPLMIIGDGPERKKLKKLASEGNIILTGELPDRLVYQYYENCLAFVMPQEEDFGISPIEAMSHGKPVLALRKGAALEYIIPGINGEFFEDPCEEMLADGARRLKENLANYDPAEIKKTAEWFSRQRFEKEVRYALSLIQAKSENQMAYGPQS